MNIADLPVEIITIIATYDFRTFKTLLDVPKIGTILSQGYPQIVAKSKFIKITTVNEVTYYTVNNELSRYDGPAYEDFETGYKSYWKHGMRHRVDGPAVITSNDDLEYWVNGKRHRVDGPAIIYRYGNVEYWVDNVFQQAIHIT
jgi:hypothetical protein